MDQLAEAFKFSKFKAKHGLSHSDVCQMFGCSTQDSIAWSRDKDVPVGILGVAHGVDVALTRYRAEYNINDSASYQVKINKLEKLNSQLKDLWHEYNAICKDEYIGFGAMKEQKQINSSKVKCLEIKNNV